MKDNDIDNFKFIKKNNNKNIFFPKYLEQFTKYIIIFFHKFNVFH